MVNKFICKHDKEYDTLEEAAQCDMHAVLAEAHNSDVGNGFPGRSPIRLRYWTDFEAGAVDENGMVNRGAITKAMMPLLQQAQSNERDIIEWWIVNNLPLLQSMIDAYTNHALILRRSGMPVPEWTGAKDVPE